MPKIFVSYRRADSAETTTRLYDRLVYAFGRENVFKDVDSIQRGDDFPDVLREWVMTCNVFLAVIGQKWLTVQDETGRRRIDGENDWVRQETQMALERGKGIVLIPTVVDGGALPGEHTLPEALRQLAFKDAQTLHADRFHADVSALITSIRRRFGLVDAMPPLDLHKAHGDLADVMRAKDWDAARDILTAIRTVGNVPAHFQLDAIEKGLYRLVNEEQRSLHYAALARNADLVNLDIISFEEVKAGVEEFLQIYKSLPDNDSANLHRFISITKLSKATESTPKTPPRLSKLALAALDRAHGFKGKRNSDWESYIVTFNELRIPEMPFCLVPVGPFRMGDESLKLAKPIHIQHLKRPYYIAQYPVTNAQWAKGVEAGAVEEPKVYDSLKWYLDPSMADAPVVGVTWDEAVEFADWMGCRLPNEVEWEYAAKGIESLNYPWGNNWESHRCVWSGNGAERPASVESKPEGASWVGACHLVGNVWEWISSIYRPYPYRPNDGREKDENDGRVLRGSAWNFSEFELFKSAARLWNDMDAYDNNSGFRCAISI